MQSNMSVGTRNEIQILFMGILPIARLKSVHGMQSRRFIGQFVIVFAHRVGIVLF